VKLCFSSSVDKVFSERERGDVEMRCIEVVKFGGFGLTNPATYRGKQGD
jgi:hypothetical protein